MTLKHIITTSTVLLGAALMALPSGIALAQGGNDPVEGIDIIMKRDPSSQPIKPFSLSDKEIAQINSIKGPERLVLVLQAVTKRVKTDEGFVKSGMAVMGKDWCGECAWPEQITYKFRNGRTTYKLGMTLSEGEGRAVSKYIGETAKNLNRASPRLSGPSGTGKTFSATSIAPSGGTPDIGDVTVRADIYGETRSNRSTGGGIMNKEVGCVTTTGAVDANCDGVADASEPLGKVKGMELVTKEMKIR